MQARLTSKNSNKLWCNYRFPLIDACDQLVKRLNTRSLNVADADTPCTTNVATVGNHYIKSWKCMHDQRSNSLSARSKKSSLSEKIGRVVALSVVNPQHSVFSNFIKLQASLDISKSRKLPRSLCIL